MRRLLTPRWLLRHALLGLAVAVCLALGLWQADRARAGNALSYAYAVEWPVFALFAVAIWAREVRLELRAGRPGAAEVAAARREPERAVDPLLTSVPPPTRPAAPDEGATGGDLAAYNDYLAWLAEDPTRRPADYRR